MGGKGKGFWISYLIFAITMFLIWRYVPAENGFIVIIIFPLVYWFIYEFVLRPKKKRKSTNK